jgi:hypothetical protein
MSRELFVGFHTASALSRRPLTDDGALANCRIPGVLAGSRRFCDLPKSRHSDEIDIRVRTTQYSQEPRVSPHRIE